MSSRDGLRPVACHASSSSAISSSPRLESSICCDCRYASNIAIGRFCSVSSITCGKTDAIRTKPSLRYTGGLEHHPKTHPTTAPHTPNQQANRYRPTSDRRTTRQGSNGAFAPPPPPQGPTGPSPPRPPPEAPPGAPSLPRPPAALALWNRTCRIVASQVTDWPSREGRPVLLCLERQSAHVGPFAAVRLSRYR